ncbi:hypothetical protein [Catenulispora subtropica]|uniref:Uncharacterized protein n=1 Tax=Catenulispora subtropica TaxID=450798 RepID=A0ABN2QIP8_9ACTN
MSTPSATPIARFDSRVRIAAALLRSAPRGEHLAVAGIALTSAAAAWPFGGALYPLIALPALLASAALVRHHLDGLGARRDALAAAGANAADTLVIQITGPLGAVAVGALAGIAAAVATGRPATPALVPLAVGTAAALVIRRAWLGAPALAAGSLAALTTAVAIRVITHPAAAVQPRSRSSATGHAAAVAQTETAAHAAAWGTAWPSALAALLVLAATQAAIVHRDALRRLARRLTALSGQLARRLAARSGA